MENDTKSWQYEWFGMCDLNQSTNRSLIEFYLSGYSRRPHPPLPICVMVLNDSVLLTFWFIYHRVRYFNRLLWVKPLISRTHYISMFYHWISQEQLFPHPDPTYPILFGLTVYIHILHSIFIGRCMNFKVMRQPMHLHTFSIIAHKIVHVQLSVHKTS